MEDYPERTITCIIIDDEKDACDRLEHLLGKINKVNVLATKTSAGDGIKAIFKLIPDIVFLDIEMSDKSGFEIIRDVRRKKINPKFIIVTGFSQYAIKAIHNAAFDYLLKPVDIDELKASIDRYIDSRKKINKKILPQRLKTQYALTNREIEMVLWLLEGKTSNEIAGELFISKHTVDTHRRNILEKVGVRSTNDLIHVLNIEE